METLITLQITIFLLVATGFVLKRIHIVGPQGQKNINDMVIYVILPCNILRAFLDSPADGGLDVLYRGAFDFRLHSGFLRDIRAYPVSQRTGGKK